MTEIPEDPAAGGPEHFLLFLDAGLRAVRAAESLTSAVSTLQPVLGALQRVAEADPELKPELLAALDMLREVAETLQRAGLFAKARYEVQLEELKAHYGLTT